MIHWLIRPQNRTSETLNQHASECSHFRTNLSFWLYLAPITFRDDISNGSRVIALSNKQAITETLLKTVETSRLTDNGDSDRLSGVAEAIVRFSDRRLTRHLVRTRCEVVRECVGRNALLAAVEVPRVRRRTTSWLVAAVEVNVVLLQEYHFVIYTSRSRTFARTLTTKSEGWTL